METHVNLITTDSPTVSNVGGPYLQTNPRSKKKLQQIQVTMRLAPIPD